MKRNTFIAWATNTDGWRQDRYGHIQKEVDGKQVPLQTFKHRGAI